MFKKRLTDPEPDLHVCQLSNCLGPPDSEGHPKVEEKKKNNPLIYSLLHCQSNYQVMLVCLLRNDTRYTIYGLLKSSPTFLQLFLFVTPFSSKYTLIKCFKLKFHLNVLNEIMT